MKFTASELQAGLHEVGHAIGVGPAEFFPARSALLRAMELLPAEATPHGLLAGQWDEVLEFSSLWWEDDGYGFSDKVNDLAFLAAHFLWGLEDLKFLRATEASW